MEIVKLVESYKKTREEFAEKIKDSFKEAISEFFTKNPTWLAIRWQQYTPYFNDGDSCVFGVYGAYVKAEGMEEDAGDYGDGFEDGDWQNKSCPIREVGKFIQNLPEEIMEDMFGDHVTVTVYKDGKIETEEYEHH